MRALWKGAISFGLLYIPVRLYNAAQQRQPQFVLLRRSDHCRIRNARICEASGEEVPYEEIVRGFEYTEGEYVALEEEDFKRANVYKSKLINLVSFVNPAEIEDRFLEKPFYLEPVEETGRAYALLREALKKSGKVGIARFMLRTRERIAILKPMGDLLMLNQIRYASDFIPPAALKPVPAAEVSESELDLAVRLIERLSEPWTPGAYQDAYVEDLKRIIADKIQGRLAKAVEEEQFPIEVTDIFDILRASLDISTEEASVEETDED